jgi:hypothetical protein
MNFTWEIAMTCTVRLMRLLCGAQSVIRRLSVVSAALLSTMMGAGAASVEVKDGNVYFVQDGQQRQLTKSGKDDDPVLSPDGKWVAFTRVGNPEFDEPQDCESGEKADELRRIRVDGSGEELLYRGHEYPRHVKDPKYAYYAICWFSHKQFTSDGRYIYFLAPKWAVSAALHRFDTGTKTLAFVTDAKDVIVLSDCKKAEKRDSLVVQQHRYFLAGGSYDFYWLFDRTGKKKEESPVGYCESEQAARKAIDDLRKLLCGP